MQSGSNLEEIYYPKTIQTIDLTNQAYLRVIGIPYEEDDEGNPIYCEKLADVNINNCKNVDYMHYPYVEGDYVNLKAIKQVQNLTLINSLDRMKSMEFQGFGKLKNVTLSTMHNISTLGFNDMLRLNEVSALETVKVSDCPLIDKVSFNISNDNYKVEFVEGAKIDLGGMQSVKTIESNASIKGLKTVIIPTSTKELKFTAGYGDGINSMENVWSASANHANDGFVGMDLQDISLTYLDMTKLNNVTKAINFHIAPTYQHPNMNTDRTGNYFKPEGSIDLTNYRGSMTGMLKGVDLSLLDIKVDKPQEQISIISLFEGAIIDENQLDKVNNILDKYDRAVNWLYMFKNADIKIDPTKINIPTERKMNLTGMFTNSNVASDIDIPTNVGNVTEMFKNCKNVTTYKNNWDKEYDNEIVTTNCYIGTGGDLELVPVPWGGYGFFRDVTSEIVVRILKDDYEVTLANASKTTTEFGLVNWGDGTVASMNGSHKHVYEKAGTYTIKGHFTFGGSVPNTSLSSVLIEVKQIASNTHDLSMAFRYCSSLQKVNLNGLSLKSLDTAFGGCSSLTSVTCTNIDTTNLINCSMAFDSCSKLTTLNLSKFDTTNVVTMSKMFNGCSSLTTLNLNGWKTPNLLNMSSMFYNCKSLKSIDLSSFETRLVSDMSSLFYDCNNLTEINVSNFSTSVVDDMSAMFYGCSSLVDLDLSSFNTINVDSMKNMFRNCLLLKNLSIGKFNTDKVQDASSMFRDCRVIEKLDLSKFTMKNAETIESMFHNCYKLSELNISNFNTTNVKTMYNLFYECQSLTELDLSSFNTSNVENMSYMFYNCNKLTGLDLSNFDTIKINTMYNMFCNCKSLERLIVPFNTGKVMTMQSAFQGCQSLTELDLSSFNTSNVENMSGMFQGCSSLVNLDLSNFDTSKVITLSSMFNECYMLENLNISSFRTDLLINMSSMFEDCEMLTKIDLSKFNTSKVTAMNKLFMNCKALIDLNISSFDTAKVKDMTSMFDGCQSLTDLDLSHFVTTELTTLASMFASCNNLVTLDIGGFNTTKVTTMYRMFYNCINLIELNLSHFDTTQVTNMSGMFNGCKSVKALDINHFVTNNVTNMSNMFNNCSCDIIFTNKNTNKVTTASAMFNVFHGTTIDLTGMTLKNSTNNNNFLTSAASLVNFVPPKNISSDIKITAEKLPVETLVAIINNLATVTKTKTLEIGPVNLAKLSDAQIAIAVNKNWTVC
jgi:surface protein